MSVVVVLAGNPANVATTV